MKDPHPPISCGDWGVDEDRVVVPKHIEKRVEAIFAQYASPSPNEASTTHTLGGSEQGSVDSVKRVIRWLPQNKRFYFAFDRFGFSPNRLNTHASKSALGMGRFAEFHNPDYSLLLKNSGSEWHVKGFGGCMLKLRKRSVEIIPSCLLNFEREFVCVHHADALNFMSSVMDELRDFCFNVLYVFSLVHGGSVGRFLKVVDGGDDGIVGDVFIDSLAPNLRFSTPVVKKQYAFKTEFKGSKFAGQYLSNSAVRSVVPEIVDELSSLSASVAALPSVWKRREDPVGWIFSEGHNVMLNDMSSHDRSSWLRETFG